MKAIRPLGSGNEKDNAGSGRRQKLLAIESCCQLKKAQVRKGWKRKNAKMALFPGTGCSI
jgi:hypothetical protein